MFRSWFLELDFSDVVEESWKNDQVGDNNAMVRLKNKLKCLKKRLRSWNKSKVEDRNKQKRECSNKLEEIDKRLDSDQDIKVTRWSKLVLIKVNIMGWRLSIDKLPTCVNLDARGIDIPSVLCPICGECTESVGKVVGSPYSSDEVLSTMVRLVLGSSVK
ncbi:reverse transcriptase zinc-binding domain-containing protein [Artemisia annua]|uniref:Reverse transcriptase zinc-binding domain-containing protein n=1 Tax=Artemisia annua TaxID=35608 RepID=A0A2U1PE21_ARTAN|nr:reverse transcriptase zinc-binding domain-containing protein [Artemisia annua]